MNNQYSIIVAWCCVFGFLLAIAGCNSPISNSSRSIVDVFCDGESLTLIRNDRTSVTGNDPRKHSGGFVISSQENKWLVHWSPISTNNKDIHDIPSVTFLGASQQKLDQDSPGYHTIDTGVPMIGYRSVGDPRVCINFTNREGELRVYDGDRLRSLPNTAIPDPETPKGMILNRRRSHVYSLLPRPAIYSIPDMIRVRDVQQTKNAKAHNRFLRDIASTSFLVDDLSLVIALASPQVIEGGGLATQAMCYDFDRDELREVSIPCEEGECVDDVEKSIEGLKWVVTRYAKGKVEWTLYDDALKEVRSVELPKWSDSLTHYDRFWVPKKNALWVIEYTPLQVESPVTSHKYDLLTGAYTQAQYTIPEMSVPNQK